MYSSRKRGCRDSASWQSLFLRGYMDRSLHKMVFSSIIFLWVLLPCILLLYYVSPKPFKNGILTVFSLFFYAWGEPRYVVIMMLNYCFGRMWRNSEKRDGFWCSAWR